MHIHNIPIISYCLDLLCLAYDGVFRSRAATLWHETGT